MIAFTFTLIALLFGAVSLYHLWRFVLRGFAPSVVSAFMPVGWVLVVARELKWMPRDFTTPLLALAFVVGLVAVLIILNHEAQQPRPFR